MIEFNCPECVKPIQVSGDITGRAYTCPHCGATVGIPDEFQTNAVAEAASLSTERPDEAPFRFGGLRRGPYLIVAFSVVGIPIALIHAGMPTEGVGFISLFILLVVTVTATFSRAKNIGKYSYGNFWLWAAGVLLFCWLGSSLAPLWLLCFAAMILGAVLPEGYCLSRRVDKTGKIIAGVIIGLFVLLVAISLIFNV
jgi:hypothetical protein